MLQSAIPVIRVTTSVAAEQFFRALGFETQFTYRADESKSDPCYMTITRDTAVLHVTSFPGDGIPGGGLVYVWVDDVDALHRELLDNGVRMTGGPVDQTWGTRELGVKDADGNSIRFGQRVP